MAKDSQYFLDRCVELVGNCEFQERPTEADWKQLEREIGRQVPHNHQQFVSAFGSGTFGEDLYVQNPRASGFSRLGRERLLDYAASRALLLKDVKRNVYPKSNLVLIAATTSRNDFFLDLGAPQKSENVWFFDLGMLCVIDLRMPFPEFVYKLYVNDLDYEWAEGLRNSIWIGDCPFFKPITTLSYAVAALMFFALHKASGAGTAFLDTDYSFDDVEDPMIMGRTEVVPSDFMKCFRLSLIPGRLEDSVRNDIWYLLSPRVIAVLKEARNATDLDIIPLPVQFQTKHPGVKGYCAFGVRRQLACIDKAASDVAWSKDAPDRWIDAVYELVIKAHKVPSDCDVFLLREWPVAPILRENIASRLYELNVTGLSLRPIRVS